MTLSRINKTFSAPTKLVNTIGQNTLTSPQNINEAFNDYFSNIAKTLVDTIPQPNKEFNCTSSHLIHTVKTSFFMQPITEMKFYWNCKA